MDENNFTPYVPTLTLDSLKWRTGATMGPCRGGACEARIAELG